MSLNTPSKYFGLTEEGKQELYRGNLPEWIMKRILNKDLQQTVLMFLAIGIYQMARVKREEQRIPIALMILCFAAIFMTVSRLYHARRIRQDTIVIDEGEMHYAPRSGIAAFFATEHSAVIGQNTIKVDAQDFNYVPEGKWLRIYSFYKSKKLIAAEEMTELEKEQLKRRHPDGSRRIEI